MQRWESAVVWVSFRKEHGWVHDQSAGPLDTFLLGRPDRADLEPERAWGSWVDLVNDLGQQGWRLRHQEWTKGVARGALTFERPAG